MTRHGMLQKGKTKIGFVVPQELNDALIELAAREKRSLSSFVALRMHEVAVAEGVLGPDSGSPSQPRARRKK